MMQERLYRLCLEAVDNAYAPYSNYFVGAALITKNGEEFIGANIENVAYGDCICAERSCLVSAYSRGYRKEDIVGFGVITKTKTFGSPCGSCRQVMSELLQGNVPVYIFNSDGKSLETNIDSLLPGSFDVQMLKGQ